MEVQPKTISALRQNLLTSSVKGFEQDIHEWIPGKAKELCETIQELNDKKEITDISNYWKSEEDAKRLINKIFIVGDKSKTTANILKDDLKDYNFFMLDNNFSVPGYSLDKDGKLNYFPCCIIRE